MEPMIRILVVDDHPVTLGGMSSALVLEPDIELVAEARSVAEANAALAKHAVDIAMVDFRLPDGSAIDVLTFAQTLADPPKLLILSAFDSPQYVDAAIRLGAAGFLTKTAPLEQILHAIHTIWRGNTAFTVGQLRGSHQHAWPPLSERDAEIVAGVIAGRSNEELSLDLRIGRKTVESHLTRLFEQFEVSTRIELAVKAAREGWLDLPYPARRRNQ